MRTRSAWSLVEVLMVSAMLAVSLTVIFSGHTISLETSIRRDARLTGRLLAQSIMESAGHRLNTTDRRFFQIDTAPDQLTESLLRDEWRRPFRCVEQSRIHVVSPSGQPGGWAFDARTGPVLPVEVTSGSDLAFFSRFSYEVSVGFDVRVQSSGPAAPIDADGDGRPEVDVARVDVEVFWDTDVPSSPPRSLCKLSSLFSYPDKPPGLGDATREAGP